MSSPLRAAASGVVAAAVTLTCVLFLPAAADPVNVIKLTALAACGSILIFLGVCRVVLTRRMAVPANLILVVVGAFWAALVLSAAVAPVGTQAVLGANGRNSGLVAFGCGLILYVTLTLLPRKNLGVVMGSVIGAGLFTAMYGQLQALGLDPIDWNNPFNPIVAALGNSNFASAYLGVVAPVAAGAALWPGWMRPLRVAAGITSAFCLMVAVQSEAVQGPIAAAAGFFILALAISLEQHGAKRNGSLAALAGAAAAGVAALVAGAIWQAGPAASVFQGIAYQARLWYWQAAVAMFSDRPVLGVGLSHYGEFWRTMRPRASVVGLGDEGFSDSAHNVFLQMLAQGGLLLGATYIAFVLCTAFIMMRGLIRLHGADRLLLGAVGGGWFAFQMQSIVSIDQVPLIVLHFVLAGSVVTAASVDRLRTVRLPGSLPPTTSTKGTGRGARASAATRTATTADLVLIGSMGLVAVTLVVVAFLPLRASVAVRAGDLALTRGDGNAALQSYEKATELVPGLASHWIRQGSLLRQIGKTARARSAYREAAKRNPYAVEAFSEGGGVTEALGELKVARDLHRQAIALDPSDPAVLLAAATFELRHGGAQAARELLEPAVVDSPQVAALWAALGDSRAVLGDVDEAREAYERALTLDPAEKTALSGLDKLAAA